MGLPAQLPTYSVAEYLRREADSTDKHEYHDGQILLMAGGTPAHSFITANVINLVGSLLAGKRCRVFDSNLRVRVPQTIRYVYPDAGVICGPVQSDPHDPSGGTVTNPRLIIEVLSPSTEGYDRGEKFEHYRRIQTLQEYVLISQTAPSVEAYWRREEGAWLFTAVAGLESTARLRSVEIDLPLSEIYAGVDLQPPPAPAAE